MSQRLELPKIGDLPQAILFHRDHPAESRIILQIPNEDRTDAETYVLRTDRPSDVVWLNALKNGRALRDALSGAQHIAFFTDTGHIQEIEDLDAPSPGERVIQEARIQGAPRRSGRDRQAAMLRRSKQHLPPASPLRQYMGGHMGGRQW